MSKKDLFNAEVATFETLLRKTLSHTIYFKEWAKAQDYTGTANVFYAWREWAKSTKSKSWIGGAFVWAYSEKGYDYWHTIHAVWADLCNQNLNK